MHVREYNWTSEQLEFIKCNWNKILTKHIASEMGCSTTTIRRMGKRLNLGPKYKNRELNTVESIEEYKNKFKYGERLKLGIKVGKRKKVYEGIVIDKTNCLITLLRNNNIRDSFSYRDFITGDVKILEEAI